LNQTIHGPFREARRFPNLKLQQRDNGHVSRAAVMSLNHLLDQWLTTVVKGSVRPRAFRDYETLLRLHIRPVLGSRLIGTIIQIDLQTLYARMCERGLSARTVEYANAVLEWRCCMDRVSAEFSHDPDRLGSNFETADGVGAARVEHSIEDGHADSRFSLLTRGAAGP
jgi:hypothetical protein